MPAPGQLFCEGVGLETQSTNAPYLQWRIRQARKGAVPTGPRKAARPEGTTFKVLPLRMESSLVDRLDQAGRRQGPASRMELFRLALGSYLTSVGEGEAARLLSPEA